MRFLQWLYPGLGVKRWLFLTVLGVVLFVTGLAVASNAQILGYIETKISTIAIELFGDKGRIVCGILIFITGLLILLIGFINSVKTFFRLVYADRVPNEIKNAYYRPYLRRGPRIAVIGGGTGLPVLLRGLKEYTSNITAIVCVTDDGGSSGRLRGQYGILPPGDLRNCLVALADTEPSMARLFDYRFKSGEELKGHSLGNLLIAAMADLTGSFDTAVNEVGKVLAIRGRVVPSTVENVVLAAEMEDGTKVMGESNISKTVKNIKQVYTIPPIMAPSTEAINAILEADAIVLGPGSLYTSIIPNLLVPGITEAIQKARGIKVYVCNVMTQPGETREYSASDHLKAIYRHSAAGLVEYIIVNNKKIPDHLSDRYAQEGSGAVEVDLGRLNSINAKVIADSLIQENNYIRHNPKKLARIILNLVLEKRKAHSLITLIDQYILSERLERVED